MARDDLDIVTFGCRLNAVESEIMRDAATRAGTTNTVLINTCAVTAEAVRQARQTIRRTRRERPDARIVVSGCAAQTEAGTFAAMPEVDSVIGNAEKLLPASYAPFGIGASEKVRVNDIMSVTETATHMIDGLTERARAFVQIQNGCDHRCTFCIIPFGRGPSRSVPMGVVVDQIRRLVDNGYGEVVLTGVDITAYGGDLPGQPRLGALVGHILHKIPGLSRLRLSSIDSVEADPELMEIIASEKRLMPHLHLSLQAGDNMILKRMKRRHLREDAIRFCESVRASRPDVVFGADLIAGFPTETDEMFENSLKIVDECDLTFLHVFPFSPREGTPAARMPQLDRRLVKARAARLREAGAAALSRHLERQVGTRRDILVETATTGRTEHFTAVSLDTACEPGSIVPFDVHAHDGERLIAKAA